MSPQKNMLTFYILCGGGFVLFKLSYIWFWESVDSHPKHIKLLKPPISQSIHICLPPGILWELASRSGEMCHLRAINNLQTPESQSAWTRKLFNSRESSYDLRIDIRCRIKSYWIDVTTHFLCRSWRPFNLNAWYGEERSLTHLVTIRIHRTGSQLRVSDRIGSIDLQSTAIVWS